ncbi:MAG: hypothetical protein FJX45_03435 [Alphaproteobacteria bacterium]|nr:hypothetical protein [Alphaproteobacteria bacterium]MBM3652574.1 hypothetical protein [Alphaproteobacteria bacterium]
MALFASDARGDGSTQHTRFDTQTINMTARWRITPNDLIMFKALHNQLYADQSPSLSLNQYFLNPYQQGCAFVPTIGSTTPLGYASRSWCSSTSPMSPLQTIFRTARRCKTALWSRTVTPTLRNSRPARSTPARRDSFRAA